ncbi:hypothetical protein [Streptosporangium sp. NPDC002721]|uniref:hypothetical protein n=1 Tax=Streptosporangium sp. NPDC002721 TaxID=3366188 RepID=UPI003682A12B
MEFDKPQIREAAAAFDLERENLAAFVADATEDLNAIGDFWGGTTEGVTFFKGQGGANGYEAVTGQIIAGIKVLLDTHHEIAERLRVMTDNVEVTDWNTVADVLSTLPPADPGRPIWGTD